MMNPKPNFAEGKGQRLTGKKARPHPGVEGMAVDFGEEEGGEIDHPLEIIRRGEHLQENLPKSWWTPSMANKYKRWFWQWASFMGIPITPWLAANWDSWLSTPIYGRAMRMYGDCLLYTSPSPRD